MDQTIRILFAWSKFYNAQNIKIITRPLFVGL
jgi:hypothetical protein